jgi:hypothetical protein
LRCASSKRRGASGMRASWQTLSPRIQAENASWMPVHAGCEFSDQNWAHPEDRPGFSGPFCECTFGQPPRICLTASTRQCSNVHRRFVSKFRLDAMRAHPAMRASPGCAQM